MIRGIDVSHHNPNPDFNQAKAAGVQFVYIKATEGVSFRDPQYQPNALNAMKAGLPIGFYHFAHPGVNKPEDEAKNFVEAISAFKYSLLPVLDLEVNQKGLSDEALFQWAQAFINEVKSKTGHNVMLYTGLYFLNQYPSLKNLNVPLWIAAYRSNAPAVPWTVWQYTDKESIPGVGTCDANYTADLSKILIAAPAAPKPAQPAKPSQPAKPVVNLPNVVLKLGDRGPAVKAVQEALNKLNFKCGEPDGIYGPKTQDAVLRFQKMYGIKPYDGVYGPKTREKMLELLKG